MEASEILPVSSEDEDSEPALLHREATMDSYGGDLLLGYSAVNLELRSQHPDPIQGFRLWQAFLDNVNPMTKLLHAPSVQKALLEAMGNLDKVPRAIESLMFAVYACAVCSMSNADCENVMGEARLVLLAKFQHAARQALVSAGWLKTSDIVALQAFTLFLVSMPPYLRRTPYSHSKSSTPCARLTTDIHYGRLQG